MSDQLQAARAAAREALGGKSPRAMGEARRLEGLRWIHRWGWSAPALIDQICGSQRGGLAARWVKQGLCDEHLLEAGFSGVAKLPRKAITLTDAGVALVEQKAKSAFAPYEYKIPTRTLLHDYTVQRLTAYFLSTKKINDYRTPNEMFFFYGKANDAEEKECDAEFMREVDGLPLIIGVEIELTQKRGIELDRALAALVRSVEFEPMGEPRLYHKIYYYCSSKATIDAYRERLKPGAKIPLYKRSPSRHFVPSGKHIAVSEEISERILFHKIKI